MSCSQSGTTHSVFIRFLIVSNTAWNTNRHIWDLYNSKPWKSDWMGPVKRQSQKMRLRWKKQLCGGLMGQQVICISVNYILMSWNLSNTWRIKTRTSKTCNFHLCQISKSEKDVSWIPISFCSSQIHPKTPQIICSGGERQKWVGRLWNTRLAKEYQGTL